MINNLKKFRKFSILLLICVLGILCFTYFAYAQTSQHNLKVQNKKVQANNNLTIDSSTQTGPLQDLAGSTITNTYWHTDTFTLDLTGVEITTFDELYINLPNNDVSINVVNNNKIYGLCGTGIFSRGNLQICGTGNLEVDGADSSNKTSSGIRVENGSLIVNNINLKVNSGKSTSSSYGIYTRQSKGTITMNNANVDVVVNGDKAINQGISCQTGIEINQTTLNVTVADSLVGHSQENNIGIYQASGNAECGVVVQNSNLTLKSGNSTDNSSYGLKVLGSFICKSSVINASSGSASGDSKISCGISSKHILEIVGHSEVTCIASNAFNSYGITSNEDINVTASKLTTVSGLATQYSNGIWCNGNSFHATSNSIVEATSGEVNGSSLERTSSTAIYATKGFLADGSQTVIKAQGGKNSGVGSTEYDVSIGISAHGTFGNKFEVYNGAQVWASSGESTFTSYGIYASCPVSIGSDNNSDQSLVCAFGGQSVESYGIYSNGANIINAICNAFGKVGTDYSVGLWSDNGSITFNDNLDCQFGGKKVSDGCVTCGVYANDNDTGTSMINFAYDESSYFIDNCEEVGSISHSMKNTTDDKPLVVQYPEIGLTSIILDDLYEMEVGSEVFSMKVNVANFLIAPTTMNVLISNKEPESNFVKEFENVPYDGEKLILNLSDLIDGEYNIEVSTSQFDYKFSSESLLNIVKTPEPVPDPPEPVPEDNPIVDNTIDVSEMYNAETSDNTPVLIFALVFVLSCATLLYSRKKLN